ncbi:MAG: hypothetical protein ACM3OO_13255 [Planctomycetaceae bacterium]
MRRVSAVVSAICAFLLVVPGEAFATVTPKAVITGPEDQWQGFANDTYLAWTTNSVAHPNHFDALIRPLAGGSTIRANARGTEGFPGNFDPGSNRLIYEQGNSKDVGIYFYDVDSGRRWKVPGVNSTATEWQPKVSSTFVLFQRNRWAHGRWYTDMLLYARASHRTRRIGTWPESRHTVVRTGNVGDRYATFMVANKHGYFAYVYDAQTKTVSKIPTKNGKPQWGPVVDEAGGTVYVWRSGDACGANSTLLRMPISLEGSPTKIVALPQGIDTGWVTSLAPDPSGGVDAYFYRIRCGASQGDIYVAKQVDAVT